MKSCHGRGDMLYIEDKRCLVWLSQRGWNFAVDGSIFKGDDFSRRASRRKISSVCRQMAGEIWYDAANGVAL